VKELAESEVARGGGVVVRASEPSPFLCSLLFLPCSPLFAPSSTRKPVHKSERAVMNVYAPGNKQPPGGWDGPLPLALQQIILNVLIIKLNEAYIYQILTPVPLAPLYLLLNPGVVIYFKVDYTWKCYPY